MPTAAVHERMCSVYPAVLWFDSNAEEAVEFYLSIFNSSRRLDELPNNGDSPASKAHVFTFSFELDGQRITAMNGGPGHPLTDAFSLVVRCDSQKEIDDYWGRLTEGGSEVRVKHPKAMQVLMKMVTLDIAELERAARS